MHVPRSESPPPQAYAMASGSAVTPSPIRHRSGTATYVPNPAAAADPWRAHASFGAVADDGAWGHHRSPWTPAAEVHSHSHSAGDAMAGGGGGGGGPWRPTPSPVHGFAGLAASDPERELASMVRLLGHSVASDRWGLL